MAIMTNKIAKKAVIRLKPICNALLYSGVLFIGLSSCRNEISKSNENLEESNKKMTEASEKLEESNKRIESLEGTIEENKEVIKRLEENLDDLTGVIEKTSTSITKMVDPLKEMSDGNAYLANGTFQLLDELKGVKSELNTMVNYIDGLNQVMEEFSSSEESNQELIENMKNALEGKNSIFNLLNETNEAIDKINNCHVTVIRHDYLNPNMEIIPEQYSGIAVSQFNVYTSQLDEEMSYYEIPKELIKSIPVKQTELILANHGYCQQISQTIKVKTERLVFGAKEKIQDFMEQLNIFRDFNKESPENSENTIDTNDLVDSVDTERTERENIVIEKLVKLNEALIENWKLIKDYWL